MRDKKVALGEKLRKIRMQRGLLQGDVARRLGVKQSTLSHWETGKSLPVEKIREKVLGFYGLGIEDLYGYQKPDQPWAISIPIWGIVEAGATSKPRFPLDDVQMSRPDYDRTIPDKLPVESIFALRVHGPSLEPEIFDKGLVYVSMSPKAKGGRRLHHQRYPVVKVRKGVFRVCRDGVPPGKKPVGHIVGVYRILD